MSRDRSNNFLKRHGIYYTNKKLANEMIDALDIDYSQDFSVAEIAVGEGHILKYIILRYLRENKNVPLSDKIYFLENKVFAFDNREEAIHSCKNNLNMVVEKEIGKRVDVNWNIKLIDALDRKTLNKYRGRFDYIISNPPFVAKKNLSLKQREFLNKESKFCQRFNYNFYYYFFEIGFILWNNVGKMVYITPNTYLKAKSAENMNNFFEKGNYIEKIIDFKNELMFEEASVYTAITVFSNNNDFFRIEDSKGNVISKKSYLQNEKDMLLKDINTLKLGAYTKIRTGIATLQDKVFIIKANEIIKSEGNILFFKKNNKEFKIEKGILKEAYRASDVKNKNLVVFPYTYNEEKILKMNNIEEKYPFAYKYLTTTLSTVYKQKYGIYWGRTQGIYDYYWPKIVVPRVMRPQTDAFKKIDKGFVVSGIYIVVKNKMDSKKLQKFLNSSYVQNVLVHFSPVYVKGYVNISSNLLKNISLPSELVF